MPVYPWVLDPVVFIFSPRQRDSAVSGRLQFLQRTLLTKPTRESLKNAPWSSHFNSVAVTLLLRRASGSVETGRRGNWKRVSQKTLSQKKGLRYRRGAVERAVDLSHFVTHTHKKKLHIFSVNLSD